MCSISSLTNSPACVLGAFPSRLSCFARSSVSFSGIYTTPLKILFSHKKARKAQMTMNLFCAFVPFCGLAHRGVQGG
jgi:hypothetical protein